MDGQSKKSLHETKTYCQLVFVKEKEVDDYKKHYPGISFVELPKEANTLGVGAPRFWMLDFAKKLKKTFVFLL